MRRRLRGVRLVGCTIVSEANRRDHWATKKRRGDAQRLVARAGLKAAIATLKPHDRGILTRGAVVIRLVRYAARKLDTDNLASGFKAIRDEVAKVLGHDDGPDAPIIWEYDQSTDRPHGAGIEIWTK